MVRSDTESASPLHHTLQSAAFKPEDQSFKPTPLRGAAYSEVRQNMQLDRTKQLAMLQALAAVYPRYTADLGVESVTEEVLANLWYLKEQGLVEGGLDMSISQTFIFEGAKITAKGLDFLENDGGISAILGTLTVRLHADTIRDLLLARIDASDAPPDKKSWLKKQLDLASAETIKRIVGGVVDEGIKRAPDLVKLIEKFTQNSI